MINCFIFFTGGFIGFVSGVFLFARWLNFTYQIRTRDERWQAMRKAAGSDVRLDKHPRNHP